MAFCALQQKGLDVWLRPQDVVVQLPGVGYDSSDCQTVYSCESSHPLPSVEPIWEKFLKVAAFDMPVPTFCISPCLTSAVAVKQTTTAPRDDQLQEPHFYLEDLASEIFGHVSALSFWLAFRFATANGKHFKQVSQPVDRLSPVCALPSPATGSECFSRAVQVGRNPPCFEARPPEAVWRAKSTESAGCDRQAVMDAWVGAFRRAAGAAADAKPDRRSLLDSPHADVIVALEVCFRQATTRRPWPC